MSERIGAIPRQLLRDMIEAGYIKGAHQDCLQPCSLDLTLTEEAYRLRGSYLPKPGESIQDIVTHGSLYRHPLDLPLEVDGIYLIKLNESLALPPSVHASISPKSSTGRIDVRARLVADGIPRFDSVPTGYRGTLWLEIIPSSFPVRLHPGDRLAQMRLFYGESRMSSLEHRIAYDRYGLLRDTNGGHIPASSEILGHGITMTVDLSQQDIVGWQAHATPHAVLDTAIYDHDPRDFFEPVHIPHDGELLLRNGCFYILATKERIIIPPTMAAEMVAYDSTKGEFRSHFAGFFDPGFGWSVVEQEKGQQAVLEVATHEHDFILRDGQPICLFGFEKLTTKPDVLYGKEIQSHYAAQKGPQLAKWFKS